MVGLSFAAEIRRQELELVLPYLWPGAKILEIGSGAGWQAKELTDLGYTVSGIDIVQDSKLNYNYEQERVYEVDVYDGHTIPFPDNYFQVVFSSNVLEHISHVEEFQSEIKRVLVKEGISIHLMPSTSWRFWTSITFYLVRIKRLFTQKRSISNSPDRTDISITLRISFGKRIIPPRHGERGNLISEHYLFSRIAWVKLFRKTGWEVISTFSNGIFYTGEQFMGWKLPFKARRFLSKVLGGACNVYILKKVE